MKAPTISFAVATRIGSALLASFAILLAGGWRATALTIIPAFDNSILFDPQAGTIIATVNSAIDVYQATFSDPVTVHITFQEMNSGLGGSSTLTETFSYVSYRSALVSHATTIDDATALAHMPVGAVNPVNFNFSVNVKLALARALGLTTDTGSPDSTISLNTSICNLSPAQTDSNKYSLFAVVSHEIDEALGLDSTLNGLTNGAPTPAGPVAPEDLFRYDQNGARSFTAALGARAYFSIDGTALLARFNQTQGGDFSDWYSPGGQTPQVQDAFQTPGAAPVLGVELRVLDAIGYTRPPSPVWVDFNYHGLPGGTYALPWPTLALGAAEVSAGGTVVIKAGNTSETNLIKKQMNITSFGGTALIGTAHPSPPPPESSVAMFPLTIQETTFDVGLQPNQTAMPIGSGVFQTSIGQVGIAHPKD